jgi:hypothetical protein
VLLSFVQFEREVTGERIRDKIAASNTVSVSVGWGGTQPSASSVSPMAMIRARDRQPLRLGAFSAAAVDLPAARHDQTNRLPVSLSKTWTRPELGRI